MRFGRFLFSACHATQCAAIAANGRRGILHLITHFAPGGDEVRVMAHKL